MSSISSRTGSLVRQSSFENKLFQCLYSLFNESSVRRSDTFSFITILVQVLQLISLVLNSTFIPTFSPIFDPRTFLEFLSRFTLVNHVSFSVFGTFFTIILTTLLLVFSVSVVKQGQFHSKLKTVLRISIELYAIIYFPLSLRFLPHLSCSPSSHAFLSLRFYEPPCGSFVAFWLTFGSVLMISLLFTLAYLHHCFFFDRSLFSKRLWSRSHSNLHFLFLLSQIIIPTILALLPNRVWLFRIVYLLFSLFIAFAFAWLIPFYFKKSCLLFTSIISLWPGTAVAYLIYNYLDQYLNTTGGTLNLLLFIGIPLLSSSFMSLMSSIRYKNRTSVFERAKNGGKILVHNISVSVSDLDDVLTAAEKKNSSGKFHGNIPLPSTFYQADSLLKVLFPKPLKCSNTDILVEILSAGCDGNPDAVDILLLRHLVELFVSNNPLSTVSLASTLTSLDIELNFSQRYFKYWLEKNAEEMRRAKNTGDASLDADTYVNHQKRLIDLKEIHEDTLTSIHQFWSILLAPNPDLSYLPAATSRIQKNRQSAESMFSKLLASHPHDRDLLVKYSSFLKEVAMDNELATFYSVQADLLTNTSDKSSNYGSSSAGSKISHNSDKKKRRRRLAKLSLITSKSISSTTKKSSIGLLSSSIVASMMAMIIIAGISYSLMFNSAELTVNIMQQTLESSHFVYAALRAGNHVYSILGVISNFTSNILNSGIDSLVRELLLQAEHVNYHLRRIFGGSNVLNQASSFVCPRVHDVALDKPTNVLVLNSLFQPSLVSLNLRTTSPFHYTADVVNLVQFVLSFSATLAKIATRLSSMNSPSVDSSIQRWSSFVFLNTPTLASEARDFWYVLVIAAYDFFALSKIMIGISTGVTLFLTFSLGLLLFAPIFRKISHDRNEVLNLFFYVPKYAIQSILADSKFLFLQRKKTRTDFHTGESDTEEYPNHEQLSGGESVLTPLTSRQTVFDVEEEESECDPKVQNTVVKRFYVFTGVVVFLLLIGFVVVLNCKSTVEDEFSALSVFQQHTSTLSSLDAESFDLVQSFVATGDPFFLFSYYQLVHSSQRISSLQSIFSLIGTFPPSIFETLTREEKQRADLAHLNDVVLYLSVLAHGLDMTSFPPLLGFSYDWSSETLSHVLSVQYSDMDLWYSSSLFDSQLSSLEQLTIASHVLSSSYYSDLKDSIQKGLVEFTDAAVNYTREHLHQDYRDILVSSIILISLSIVVIILIILNHSQTLSFVKLSLKRLFYVFHFVVLLLITVLVVISFLNYSKVNLSINSLSETLDFLNGLTLISREVQSSWNLVQVFKITGKPEPYFKLSSSLVVIQQELQHLSDVLNKYDDLRLLMSNFEVKITEFIAHISISSRIIFSLHNLPLVLAPELINFTWNIQDHPNFHLLSVSDLINSYYNNTEYDLNHRTEESKLNLINFLLNSRSFYSFSYDIQEQILKPIISSFVSLQSKFLNKIIDEASVYRTTQLIIILTLVAIVFLVCLIVYNLTHTITSSFQIVQTIHIELTSKFTTQYIVALSLLCLFLMIFFGTGSYYLIQLEHRPRELTIAGSRLSLVPESFSTFQSLLIEPNLSQHRFKDLGILVDQLSSTHAELLYVPLSSSSSSSSSATSSNRYAPMTELLFDTRYNTNDTGHADHGLDFLLARYINLLQTTSKREVTELDFNSEETTQLYDIIGPLTSLCLDALDLILSETLLLISQFKLVITIILIGFIVFVVCLYWFLFRNMLLRLTAEEELSKDLISMIPVDVIESCRVVREYLASMDC
ncbi:hypothetical protein RCL1_007654 [Eukaryota sp. TZLM3-RCL]